jgi:hypothetical protein
MVYGAHNSDLCAIGKPGWRIPVSLLDFQNSKNDLLSFGHEFIQSAFKEKNPFMFTDAAGLVRILYIKTIP